LFDYPIVQQTERIVFGNSFSVRLHPRKGNCGRIAPQQLRVLAQFPGKNRRPQPDHSLGQNRAQFNFDSALGAPAIGVGVQLDLPHRLPYLRLREDPASNHHQALDIAQPPAPGPRIWDYGSLAAREAPGQENAGDTWSGGRVADPCDQKIQLAAHFVLKPGIGA
jgi:hypothetical protein